MKDKKILQEIYTRKLTGVMYHNDFYNFFKLLGLDGFASVQGTRQLEEYGDYIKIGNYFIEKYGCFPEVCGEPVPFNDPYGIREKKASEITPEEKKCYVETILCEWKDWEASTIEFLSEKIRKIECPHTKKFVYKLCKDTIKELDELKKSISVLKDHEWCLHFMHSIQYHLLEKSEEGFSEVCKDLKKEVIADDEFAEVYAMEEKAPSQVHKRQTVVHPKALIMIRR